MKIRTRLQLSIILSLILIVTIGSFVFIALQEMDEEIEKARITNEIVRGIAELKIVTHEYLLHPTERSLMQWKSTYDNLTSRLTKEVNEFESPPEKIALGKILNNITRFKATFDDLITGFRKEQRIEGKKNAIPSDLTDRLIGELLVKSQATVSPIFQLQQVVQTELMGTQQRTSLLIVIFLIILAAFVTAISLWISKSIGGPIAELEKDIRIIGSGNLDYKVGTTAKDEIGHLSRAFDKMTVDLKDTTASIAELNKEIIERKQAEEALRESDERYAALFDRSLDCVYIHDFEGNFIDANPAALKLFGYTREEILSLNFASLLSQDQMSLALQTLEKVKKDGFQKDITEFKLTAKNGEHIYIETKASLLYHEGEPYAIQGIGRDITNRKRSEEALRESEERYRTILESIEEIYFEVDIAGNFTFFNDSLSKSLGYSNDELMGMNNRDYMSPESSKKIYDLFNQIYNTGKPIKKVVYEIIRKDGVHGFHEMSASLMKNQADQPIGFRGIAHDITERTKAEEAIRESEENLAKAQKMAHIGSWSRDVKMNQSQWSDEMYRIFGLTPGDPAQPSLETFLFRVHPEDRERVTSALKEAPEKKKSFDFKFRTVPIEGSERVIHSQGEIECDETGASARLFGTVQDLTETSRLQARLQQAQKMEAIGTLAGGVAHDLNNILGGLVSYPELLLLKLPEDSPLRSSILTIQKSGEKAAAVVQDLLTLARRGVVITDVVNLNDVIAEYLKSPECENLRLYHPGVHIETHLEKDVLNILGSSIHLSKTVMNLVSNAAEAMPEGGRLTVSTENRYIDSPIRGYDDVKEGDYVVLTISDTGTGISPDDIEKIFEPFYTKKKMGRSGTGLGMAVVWGTVKDHNGYIDVQSIEGEGTTFTLYFPVTRKNLPEDKSHLAIETYRGNGESILIIDDVEEQRQIASGMLKELGYSAYQFQVGKRLLNI